MRLFALSPSWAAARLVWAGQAAAKTERVTLRGTVLVKHADVFRKDLAEYWYTLKTKRGPVKLSFRGQGPTGLGGSRVIVHGTRKNGMVRVPAGGVRILSAGQKTEARANAVGPQHLAVFLLNFQNNATPALDDRFGSRQVLHLAGLDGRVLQGAVVRQDDDQRRRAGVVHAPDQQREL